MGVGSVGIGDGCGKDARYGGGVTESAGTGIKGTGGNYAVVSSDTPMPDTGDNSGSSKAE